MNTKPLVSIIIPTFNRSELILDTLDSIIKQTYQNWECIIIDDGSTDKTNQIVNRYIEKDSRFQFYSRPENRLKGGNAARNYGFELSKGELINWFDSDDLMHENLLEEKIRFFENNNDLDFVICGFRMFQNEIYFEKEKWLVKNKDHLLKRYLSKEIILNTQVILWKREKIKHFFFNENLTRAQDLDFIFRAFNKMSCKFEIVPNVLVDIRIHDKTISNSYKKGKAEDIKSEINVRKTIFLNFIHDRDKEYKKKIRNIYLIAIRKSLITSNYFVFFDEIIKAKHIHRILKLKLFFIGILYFFSKKGISRYSKILNA